MADRVMHVEYVVLAFVGLLLPLFAPSNNRRVGRCLFWGGLLLATVAAFFIAYPPDWRSGILLSLLCGVLMLITAYFNSPFIKIRSKIFALFIEDSLPDPATDGTRRAFANPDPAAGSYGGAITLKKLWLLSIFVVAICSFNVLAYFVDRDNSRLAVVMAVALVAVAAILGYRDASEGYPIARGQHVQFAIVSIISAGVFTIVYLLAYRTGKRWPLHRKQNLEDRAHPRPGISER